MIEETNTIRQKNTVKDEIIEKGHRPYQLKEFVGQTHIIENLAVMIKSSKARNGPMDHILLSGPPGLGKTSLALLIAKEINSSFHLIAGPTIERKGDLAATLANLSDRSVLFIDEIHRIPLPIEEIMYSAMEDFRLDIIIGQGAQAKTMRINLPHFTLIGATTKSGLLSMPLRDRFTAQFNFEYYSTEELEQIIKINALKMNLLIGESSRLMIASRSRATPRIALRILRRVRDFAFAYNYVQRNKEIDDDITSLAMKMLKIDSLGLDEMDRKILQTIRDIYGGGPVGIDALSATLNEEKTTIEEIYEPFLLKSGLLKRSNRGRTISQKALDYLRLL